MAYKIVPTYFKAQSFYGNIPHVLLHLIFEKSSAEGQGDCLVITLLSSFLVNFLVIFLLGSIKKVVFDTKKFDSMKNSLSMKNVY